MPSGCSKSGWDGGTLQGMTRAHFPPGAPNCLAFEPYHVAYEMERGPQGEVSAEAAAAVAEGRRRQRRWRQAAWLAPTAA